MVLADDTEDGFGTDADWDVKLYPYQQEGANVLFFTFVNPESMKIPKAFEKLGKLAINVFKYLFLAARR